MLKKLSNYNNFYPMKDEGLICILQKIGTVVREHRKKHKMSQFHLGLEVGKSANQIGRIERAESNPTIKTLYTLAHFFDIELNEFLKS